MKQNEPSQPDQIILDLQFQLLKATEIEEIYKLLAVKIHELLGQGIVMTSILDEESQSMRVVEYTGLRTNVNKVIKVLGFDPRKAKYHLKDMTEEELAIYRSGRLEILEDGLHALLTRKTPRAISNLAAKALGVHTVYTMGCVYNKIHHGGLIILTDQDISKFINTIEQLVNQAAILIQRIVAERRAHENEMQFRMMFEQHSAVMLIIDPETGQILDANQSAIEFYGYAKEDLCSFNISKINLMAVAEIEAEMKRALDRNRNVFYFSHQLASGEVRQVEVRSSPINYSGKRVLFSIIEDISKQEEYIKEIEEKNHFIEKVLDNLPIGIALNRIDEGGAFYMNAKFQEIYGWPMEEIDDIHVFFTKILPDEKEREERTTRFWEDISSRDPARMYWEDIEITRKDGEKRIINALNIPLFEQDTMVSTVWDVTAVKEYEEAILKAKEKAEDSDRLKTEFIQNMSHEIRTPMNGIKGFASLLEKPGLSPDKQKNYIRIINDSSNQLLRIIDDILEISTLGTRQVEVVNEEFRLNELLGGIVSIFEPAARKKHLQIGLKEGLFRDSDQVFSDVTKVSKIINNLVENALKYTDQGFIEVGYVIEDRLVRIDVKDSGRGISAENLEVIFERFSQENTHPAEMREGLGLGLAIAKENALLLGGRILVHSEKGTGSTFTLEFPYLSSDPDKEKHRETTTGSAGFQTPRITILVAEDDDTNFMYYSEVIHQGLEAEITLVRAIDGDEAVKVCMENNEIGLVLMDIKLPGVNGIEATKKIKAARPALPVIAQTAYSSAKDRQIALDAGCSDFISKPGDEEKLKALIRRYLES